MTPRDAADGFVAYAALQIVWIALAIIFAGDTSGPGPFLAGAAIVADALFVEFYFREEVDA